MEDTKSHPSKRVLIPIIAASSVGTLIEWYDFFVFGSLATIISTKFFPKEDVTAAFLATLATYAAGLLVRPFGALFFGRLGDLIGRKYTFMVTLVLMGGSTFAIGLIPVYDTIGFFAPLVILILRLLQGLAIGGEYGGAATFVAEHSPVKKRGYWTSWIQLTAIFGFVISLGVIQAVKDSLSLQNWENWGWRIPFLVSVFLVCISIYIRKNMVEPPLFARAKAEGKTSVNPLKESFGNKQNLKFVLLALFGITMGLGVMSWSSVFYVQSFFINTLFLDYDQVNTILIIGMLLAMPLNVVFGWLSDRTGRKPLIVISLLLAVVSFRPLYEQIYQTVNLNNKVENKSQILIDTKEEAFPGGTLVTKTTRHFYTDETIYQEVEGITIADGKPGKPEVKKTVNVNNFDKWKLVFLLFILVGIGGMAYGPLAAYLVEMFPLKIRYTSMSFPYHIGFGVFGGMALVIATYLVNKATEAHSAQYYLAGLTYALIIMSIAFVIGLFYLKENMAEHPKKARSPILEKVKRALGVIWILLGIAAAYFGIFELGIPKIMTGKPDDLIFGMILTFVITPITAVGLILFGKYALQGEFDELS